MFESSPSLLISLLWNKIPRYTIIQFSSSLIFGLLVHMFFLTNTLPNHDALYFVDSGFILRSASQRGLWFTFFPHLISGGTFTFPWLNSLFVLIYVSFSACFIGASLFIRKTYLVLLLSAVMISFPAVASGLAFIAVSSNLFFSVLLATLAVYLLQRFKYGFLFCVIPLILSLAVYQASFGFFTGLIIILLIRDILIKSESANVIFLKCAKYLSSTVLGIVLYFLSILPSFLSGGFMSYANIDTFGGLTLQNFPIRFIGSYRNFLRVIYDDVYGIHPNYMSIFDFRILFLLTVGLAFILIVHIIISRELYKNKLSLFLLLMAMAIVPPSINVISIISAYNLHLTMQYSVVLVFVLALTIIDIADISLRGIFSRVHRTVVSCSIWVLLFIHCVVIMNYMVQTNIQYLSLNATHIHAKSFSTTLITRIQSEAFYSSEKPILLAGIVPQSHSHSILNAHIAGRYVAGSLPNWWSYHSYLINYLGLDNVVKRIFVVEESAVSVFFYDGEGFMEMFHNMPIYPASGSIVEIEGIIVVRLSE